MVTGEVSRYCIVIRSEIIVRRSWLIISTCDIHPRPRAPDSEWHGLLHRIQPKKPIKADFMSYMQRGIDLRPSSIKRWWGNLQTEAAAKDQA